MTDPIQSEIERIRNADTIGETKFSKLFHEARTTTPSGVRTNGYSGVSVQIRVKDGELQVHNDPVKTRQGEHLRGTDKWDSIISIPVKPFMETRTAKNEITRQLKEFSRRYR